MLITDMHELHFDEIKPKICAKITNGKADLLHGQLSAQINDLLEQRGVLVFPKIGFTDEEQVIFTNLLGGSVREIRSEEVFKVSLDRKINQEVAECLLGSLTCTSMVR